MKKRSKYRPKGVRADNISYVLSGLKGVTKISAGTTLLIQNHDALNTIRLGTATRREVDMMISAFNVAEALAVRDVGNQYAAEIRAAQDAVFALATRGATTGRFVITGPELQALNLGMEIHDAQLEVVTVAELEKAMDYVREVIRNKRTRRVPTMTKEAEHGTNP